MKSIKNYLNTCLESLLDDDDAFYDPENDKKEIENWIKDNYTFSGNLTVSDDLVVDCSGRVKVGDNSITSFTNGLFKRGIVSGSFVCNHCKNLKSLEGAPENVGEDFYCAWCNSLTSLEGTPKKIGGEFDCSYCKNLKTLEGVPEEVGNNFRCNNCDKLKSLKGAPEIVGGYFSCSYCKNLKTLKGAPGSVGGKFYCGECPNLKITDSDRGQYNIMGLK